MEGLFHITDERPCRVPTIRHAVLSVRPHVNDMARIKEISERPWLARHIKQVDIYLGDFNIGYLVDFDNFVYNRSVGHCNFRDLSEAFSRLLDVDPLPILSKECPFWPSEKLLCDVWSSRMLEDCP